MPVAVWAFVELSACTSTLASPPTLGAVDLGCQTSEVARLLWTMIGVATAAGLFIAARPSWYAVIGTAVANLVWLWIDMEGPVLLSRGTHGVHLADIPVAISLLAIAIAAGRLVAQRGDRDS